MKTTWRSGEVDRARIARPVRRFAPVQAADSLASVSLDDLKRGGKRLILLDVDHTLVHWRGEEFDPAVLAWVERAKALGFDLCVISNTRRPERLARLCARLDVPTVRGRFKPSRAMFRLALLKFRARPEEAVMIGDQMMTDILGANRAGIDGIWVRKMDGPEFAGTKLVNRRIERALSGFVWKALVAPEDERRDPAAITTLQQLFRFAIVGGTSFVIDYCIRMTLLFALPFGPVVGRLVSRTAPWLAPDAKSEVLAAMPVAALVAWFFATFNSFVWNRRWTFEAVGHDARRRQMARFFAVAAIGGLVNLVVSTAFVHVIAGGDKNAARWATVAGALAGAVWNFLGQKLLAFRRRSV